MLGLQGLRPDPFIISILIAVAAASVLPARGLAAEWLGHATKLAIALLFFMHGAKLSPKAVITGLLHWRLHATVLSISFIVFPLLALAIRASGVLPPQLSLGFLFLCCLPSTVQASIAFTAIARGDVAAAVTSASMSNLLGMGITPLLVGFLTHAQGAAPVGAMLQGIALQLLGPFLLGQLLRPWIGGFVQRHKAMLGRFDRSSVVLVVYAAFGAAVVGGVWGRVDLSDLVLSGVISAVLLGLVLLIAVNAARRIGLDKESEIAVVFCASKKSLVTGAPMAGILFAPAVAGVVILPVMIFHQIQLMACAIIAQRYGQRTDGAAPTLG